MFAHPLGFVRRPITLRNHIPRNMYFPDGVRTPLRPLRHLYGYATASNLYQMFAHFTGVCGSGPPLLPPR